MVHKDPEGYVSASDSCSDSLDDDNDFGDWRSDDENDAVTLALFTDSTSSSRAWFKSPLEALKHAKVQHGCDVVEIVKRLQLDTLQVIRLVNHIRRNNLSPEDVNRITRESGLLEDDDELKPVPGFEDDGLLQVDFDLLSTDPETGKQGEGAGPSDKERIQELESQLATVKAAFDELRTIHASTLGLSSNDLSESSGKQLTPGQRSSLASSAARTKRGANDAEDDILYFDSYSTNSIHQTMITDSARTLSYAQFLLHPANSHLVRGKVVMDVGCGTGILSLFAARAGAKKVIAIDASAIVERARENVESNGFGNIVTVHRGKLEDLSEELKPYQGKVDLLVSEWMGYFLLYENMLPSVLVARDRYLHPETGVLAPNRMTMHLAAFSSAKLIQEKLRFWKDVHGFNMESMTTGLLDEAFVDVLGADEVVSDSYIFADLDLPSLPPKQPEPESPFQLHITTDGPVHGFISWFDTFFFPSPRVPTDASTDCPPFSLTENHVHGLDLNHNSTTPSPSTPSSGEGEEGHLVKFSTSPFSKETHWQQTLFVLKQPLNVERGDTIKGRIVVLQDQKHSRQLEVELHYLHLKPSDAADKGKKKVETQLVQVFMVR